MRGRDRQGHRFALPVPLRERRGRLRQPDQRARLELGASGHQPAARAEGLRRVISTAATPCVSGKPCPWEIANWGGGWVYGPDYYPTGEEIFASGAGSNFGGYSDPRPTPSSRRRTPRRHWRRSTTTRTTSPRTSPESGSRAPSSGWRRSARTSAASHPRTRSSPGSQKTGTSASRPGSRPGSARRITLQATILPVRGRRRARACMTVGSRTGLEVGGEPGLLASRAGEEIGD